MNKFGLATLIVAALVALVAVGTASGKHFTKRHHQEAETFVEEGGELEKPRHQPKQVEEEAHRHPVKVVHYKTGTPVRVRHEPHPHVKKSEPKVVVTRRHKHGHGHHHPQPRPYVCGSGGAGGEGEHPPRGPSEVVPNEGGFGGHAGHGSHGGHSGHGGHGEEGRMPSEVPRRPQEGGRRPGEGHMPAGGEEGFEESAEGGAEAGFQGPEGSGEAEVEGGEESFSGGRPTGVVGGGDERPRNGGPGGAAANRHGSFKGAGVFGGFEKDKEFDAGVRGSNKNRNRNQFAKQKTVVGGQQKAVGAGFSSSDGSSFEGVHKRKNLNNDRLVVKESQRGSEDTEAFRGQNERNEEGHFGASDTKVFGAQAGESGSSEQDNEREFEGDVHKKSSVGAVGGAGVFGGRF